MSEKLVEFGKSVVLSVIMLVYFLACFAILYLLGWMTVYYEINCAWTTFGMLIICGILAAIPFVKPFKSVWYKWTV